MAGADVDRAFPEIRKIKDEELRRKVREVWLEAWKRSSFKSLDDAGFTPEAQKRGLVEHVRAATGCALEIAKVAQDIYRFSINWDYLLAGGLLHDVDKLIIFKKKGKDSWAYTEIASLLPHGYIGAEIAREKGVPDEVAHIIVSHSCLSSVVPKTKEAIIVRYADHAVGDLLFHADGLPLLIERFG